MPKSSNIKTEAFEKTLFKTADKLRKNMDAAEYKHIVLGLIFLKYISDSFEELHIKIKEGKGDFAGANPEDADEYRAENVFFVPQAARWSYLHSKAMLPTIGEEKTVIIKILRHFVLSVSIDKVRELDCVLSPGRYVGLPEEKDDFNFSERFTALKKEFEEQLKEEAALNKRILHNLDRIEYEK